MKYSIKDLKAALKAANLTTIERHKVYINLPSMLKRQTCLAAAGCRVYVRSEGEVRPAIVAACSREYVGLPLVEGECAITVWETPDCVIRYDVCDGALFADRACNVPIVGMTHEAVNKYEGIYGEDA